MVVPVEPFDVLTLRDPARLTALRRTALLDATEDQAFDRLTRLASTTLGVPIALVSLVGADRQRFRSEVGLPEAIAADPQTQLSHSFCKHVVASRAPLIVEDAREDPRLQGNLAIDDLDVIAYAGWPLTTPDGHVLGSFCAIDTSPRAWTTTELQIIEDLAGAAIELVELRTTALLVELRAAAADDLAEVGQRLQEALVPVVPPLARAEVHAVYQPGERRLLVGGDLHHVAELPDGRVNVLIGDVAGHGAEAAAFAAGLRAAWAALLLVEDDDGLRMARLNAVACAQQTDLASFATALSCTIAPDGSVVTTACAGHPPPIVLEAGGARLLDVRPGTPLGVRPDAVYVVDEHRLDGAEVLVHTDGLVEGHGAPGAAERFGVGRLLEVLDALAGDGLSGAVLLEAVVDVVVHANGGPLADDLAAVLLRPLPRTTAPD